MRNLSIKSFVALAAFLGGLGYAPAQTYHTEANIDVSLTGAYTLDKDPVTKGTRTTYSSKLQTYRITTRDLMDSYRAANLIPEKEGWRLVAITRQGATSYLLRKSGRADVPVDFLVRTGNYGRAEGGTQVEDSITGTVSASIHYREVVSGDIRAGQLAVSFVGKATGSQTWRIYPTDAFYVYGSETISLYGGTGGASTTASGTMEGTISRGGDKVVKEN